MSDCMRVPTADVVAGATRPHSLTLRPLIPIATAAPLPLARVVLLLPPFGNDFAREVSELLARRQLGHGCRLRPCLPSRLPGDEGSAGSLAELLRAARPTSKGPAHRRTIGNDGGYRRRQPRSADRSCLRRWRVGAGRGWRRAYTRTSGCSRCLAGLWRCGWRAGRLWYRCRWVPDLSAGPDHTAGQREKQAFLAQPGATGDADYLQASRRDPISP
jgi:hypothetical protein